MILINELKCKNSVFKELLELHKINTLLVHNTLNQTALKRDFTSHRSNIVDCLIIIRL